ncbi:MAG: HIT family protein [Deltaproteobacteria bacterium]|nr:HIT family protein [Deltaproteobacteria bacterium]
MSSVGTGGGPGPGCPFCAPGSERVLWSDVRSRVLLAAEPGYPGFCRVVWGAHVREMTDLALEDRARLMEVVFAVEAALREVLSPYKVNLASLGNRVPHLHWHVIPRFEDDPHFPEAVWGTRVRQNKESNFENDGRLLEAIERQLRKE